MSPERQTGMGQGGAAVEAPAGAGAARGEAATGLWKTVILILGRPLAAVGLGLLVVLSLTAVFASLIATHDPFSQDLAKRMLPPGAEGHLLGTDMFGRDTFSRLVWGARVSLLVGILASGLGAVVGTFLGVVAGYWGGVLDEVISGFMDMLMAFPLLLLAIVIVAILGGGLFNLILAVAVANVPRFVRLVRAEVVTVKGREFIEAARAAGGSNARLIWGHILPNILSPIIILTTLRVSTAILTEASLSFLGLGVAATHPTWGSMIADASGDLQRVPFLSIVPGAVLAVTVLAFNLFGDGLRDALDPRLRRET